MMRTLASAATLALAALALVAGPALAQGSATPAADNPALEAQMMSIANELRCVVCQNQTVADSHAELAADLREQIRGQLRQGRSAEEIRTFMTERYGDFVLYRPPLNERTVLLWAGPAAIMVIGLVVLALVLRRRQRLPDDAFEREDGDAADEPNDEPRDAR